MLRGLFAAALFALAPLPAESLRVRVLTDDGMPLPETLAAELRCGGELRRRAGADSEGWVAFASPAATGVCFVAILAPNYEVASIPVATLPAADEIPAVVLHRLGKGHGESISVTHLAAPAQATRHFHAAMRESRRGVETDGSEVLVNLQAAVRTYPEYAQAWYEIGRLRLALNEPIEACAALERAVAADPWFVSPYEPLLLLQEALGKHAAAARTCANLRRINPQLPRDCGRN